MPKIVAQSSNIDPEVIITRMPPMDQLITDGFKVVSGFLAGLGAFWLSTRKMRAEYLDWKRRRRVIGAKALERTELVKSHAETLIRMNRRGITPEAVFAFMEFATTGKRPSSADRAIGRSEPEIQLMIDELYDKLMWDRITTTEQMIECGYQHPDPDRWMLALKQARSVEKEYGIDNLGWDRHGSGMIEGKLAALLWLTGKPWNFLGEPEQGGCPPPDLKAFSEGVERVIESCLTENPLSQGGESKEESLRKRLQNVAFSVLNLIDEGSAERIAEELHEVYSRWAWRNGELPN